MLKVRYPHRAHVIGSDSLLVEGDEALDRVEFHRASVTRQQLGAESRIADLHPTVGALIGVVCDRLWLIRPTRAQERECGQRHGATHVHAATRRGVARVLSMIATRPSTNATPSRMEP